MMIKYKKWFLVVGILISVLSPLFAVKINEDSLLRIINSNNDKLKISAFYRLAFQEKDFNQANRMFDSALYYYYQNPSDSDLMFIYGFRAMNYARHNKKAQAIILSKKSIESGKKTNNFKDIAAMDNYCGNLYFKIKNYDSAFCYYNNAQLYYKKLMHKDTAKSGFAIRKLANVQFKIATIYFNQHKYKESIKFTFYALKLYDNIDDYKGISVCHNLIGTIYNFNQDYNKAFVEYKKAIKYAEKIHNLRLLDKLNNNIGVIFLGKENYDSAYYYFRKSLEFKLKTKSSPYSTSGLYNNLGLIFKHKKRYDSALYYFNKSIDIRKNIGYKKGEIKVRANKGLTYIEMKKYPEAKKILLSALDFCKTHNMGETSKQIYSGLSRIYAANKQYRKAYRAYENYVKFKDSLNSVDINNKINEYRMRYETSKKDLEITKLQKMTAIQKLEQEKQISENKRQKIVALLLGVTTLFLIITLFYIRRNFIIKQRAARELMKKNNEISQQKIVDLIKAQEVSSINSYMEGQEKERARIAAELHDRLGSLLSAVKLHFSSIEANLDENNSNSESDNFSFALDLLDNSVEEVRSISHNLSKGILTQFGLSGAINNLKNAINSAGKIQIKFIEVGEKLDLLPEVEIELFRVIQELITNAIKHSGADEIYVQLITDAEGLTIVVEDMGVGFDMAKLKSKGIGLQNLKNRIEKIGGIYHLESTINKGTTIIIEIKNQD